MKKLNTNSFNKTSITFLLASTLMLSACGSKVSESGKTTQTPAVVDPFTTGGNGTGTVNPTPTPTPTLPNAPKYNFVISGNTNAQRQSGDINVGLFGSEKKEEVYVNTDSTLIVRVIPGNTNGLNVPEYNYSPRYNCITYTVEVDGNPMSTTILKAGASNTTNVRCPNAAVSEDLDFSSHIRNRGPKLDSNGNPVLGTDGLPVSAPVKIQITEASNDARCGMYYPDAWGFLKPLCGSAAVEMLYWSYTAKGTIQVKTDGSQFSQ